MALVTSLGYYMAKFQLLLGLISLGLAAVLLRLQSKTRGPSGDSDPGLRFITTMLVGTVMILMSRRILRTPGTDRP